MVLVSIVSAVDYFQAFWKQIDHSSSDRRKASVVLRRDKKNAAPVN
jgi:CDP-diacylglycerol---glycerol-3-phosphate 3-phosphatidyltransferase